MMTNLRIYSKIIFLIILTMLFTSCSNKKLEYEVIFNRDSTIKADGFTLNGKKHGHWRYYHSNGFVFNEGLYSKGNRWGKWNYYYTNGNINYIVNFKNDSIEGKVFEYRKNKVHLMITFHKNIIDGNEFMFIYDSLCENVVDTFFTYNSPNGSINFERFIDDNEPDFPLSTTENFIKIDDWMEAAKKGKKNDKE